MYMATCVWLHTLAAMYRPGSCFYLINIEFLVQYLCILWKPCTYQIAGLRLESGQNLIARTAKQLIPAEINVISDKLAPELCTP
jgi:hypothetical protein